MKPSRPIIHTFETIILRLAAETTVSADLLFECQELVEAIKARRPFEELLRIVNENF